MAHYFLGRRERERWNRITTTIIITQKAISWSAAGPDLNIVIIPFGLAASQSVESQNIIFLLFVVVVEEGDTRPRVSNVVINSNNNHHHHDGNIARRCKYDMTRRATPDMMRRQRQTNAFVCFYYFIVSGGGETIRIFFLLLLFSSLSLSLFLSVGFELTDGQCAGVNNRKSRTWIETSKRCIFIPFTLSLSFLLSLDRSIILPWRSSQHRDDGIYSTVRD